jgi:hypothetical protein
MWYPSGFILKNSFCFGTGIFHHHPHSFKCPGQDNPYADAGSPALLSSNNLRAAAAEMY